PVARVHPLELADLDKLTPLERRPAVAMLLQGDVVVAAIPEDARVARPAHVLDGDDGLTQSRFVRVTLHPARTRLLLIGRVILVSRRVCRIRDPRERGLCLRWFAGAVGDLAQDAANVVAESGDSRELLGIVLVRLFETFLVVARPH